MADGFINISDEDDDLKDLSNLEMSEDLTSLYKSMTYEDIEALSDEEFIKYFSGTNGEGPSLRLDLMNDPRADELFARMDRLGLSDTKF